MKIESTIWLNDESGLFVGQCKCTLTATWILINWT